MKDSFIEAESSKEHSNLEQWEDLLRKISLWEKDQYLIKSEEISLYGFMTWTLNVDFMLFRLANGTEVLKEYLAKFLFFNSSLTFDEETLRQIDNINKGIELSFSEIIECYRSDSITCREMIEDLEHFYAVSYSRFERHKQEYSESYKLIEQLENDYKKYIQYLQWLKNEWQSCEIIRLNRLGQVENEEMGESEVSLYFILGVDKLFLISLTDFA